MKALVFGLICGTIIWAIYIALGRDYPRQSWLWCVISMTLAHIIVDALKGKRRGNGQTSSRRIL